MAGWHPPSLRTAPAKGIWTPKLSYQRPENGEQVKERKPKDDGGKDFYIWTFWDDNLWRPVEPPSLPIYNAHLVTPGTTVFIHEGPKKAAFAQALIHDDGEHHNDGTRRGGWREHPFGAELRGNPDPLTPPRAVHVAWMGGARRAGEADWSGLTRRNPGNMTLMLDRDDVGEGAVRPVSQNVLGTLSAVQYDGRFPAGFDVADPFPANQFEDRQGERVYIGPSLSDLRRPATWATRRVPSERDPEQLIFAVRDEFAQDWVYVKTPGVFVSVANPTLQLKPQDFSTANRAVSDVEDTAKPFFKLFHRNVDQFTYDPGKPIGIVNVGGRSCFNSHRPANIRRIEGDASPLLDYLIHLIPRDPDRLYVMRWIATHIARPGVKMAYGILLASTAQGVGKTWLAEKILAPLTGFHNVSFPSEEDIKSAYTAWLGEKRLCVVEEIYSGDKQVIYHKLKPYVTQEVIPVRKLYTAAYDMPNFAHFILTSNARVPMPLAARDRRWLVPEITETQKSSAYWSELLHWLEGDGLSIVLDWAHRFVEIEGAVKAGDIAPDTDRKAAMIQDSVPDVDKPIRDAADAFRHLTRGDEQRSAVIMIDELQAWLIDQPSYRGKKAPRTGRIAEIMREAGLTVFDGDDRPRIGNRPRAVAINFEKGKQKWPALVSSYQINVRDVLEEI